MHSNIYNISYMSKDINRLKVVLAEKKRTNKWLAEQLVNPEKPDVPLNKNDAFQKVQKRHVQEKR